ncbi:unnamed protein product, partial [marine sediment metagenome]
RKFYIGLNKLYKYSAGGIPRENVKYTIAKSDEIIKVPKDRKEIITKLLSSNFGKEIWQQLVIKKPNLATRLSYARIHHNRIQALKKFKKNLLENKDENYWQNFFTNNDWIFGYGLNYRFLNTLKDQPNYGGADYTGKGNQKGDYLLSSEAEIKFTVLVEIKKPDTPLLAISMKSKKGIRYRNGAWLLSRNLIGGVSQLQINCKTWMRKAYDPENIEKLSKKNIYTLNPKGILVIGNTNYLDNNREKIETFEAYRRSITNP